MNDKQFKCIEVGNTYSEYECLRCHTQLVQHNDALFNYNDDSGDVLKNHICEENYVQKLTFSDLRAANIARLPLFKNSKGVIAHAKPDGSDWTPAEWLEAVIGELGEYANERKKYRRGDRTLEEFNILARKELADVLIYLDLLAFQLGIDLGEAIVEKFNEVSDRVGCDVKLVV